MRVLIVLFMILVAPAKAQQVYKCVKDKDVSYQSAPCDATQTVARQWDATPDPEPSGEDARRREHAESMRPSRATGMQRTRSASTSRQRNHGTRKPGMSPCDAAKARREAKLNAVGLKRTFDLLRRLDETVHQACK